MLTANHPISCDYYDFWTNFLPTVAPFPFGNSERYFQDEQPRIGERQSTLVIPHATELSGRCDVQEVT